MEEKVNPWKANLTNGIIMGLAGIVFTLIMYFLDKTFDKKFGYIFLLISVFLLYFFIKSYRDNYLHGRITYGQSVGAGVIIFLYSSILGAIFSYLLYKVIDPELTAKLIAFTEEQTRSTGKIPEEQIDKVMEMQKKFLRPEITAPISVLAGIFSGTIISLIVSIFTRKEGNPLIDTPENN